MAEPSIPAPAEAPESSERGGRRTAARKKGTTEVLFSRLMKASRNQDEWRQHGNNFIWVPDEDKAYVVGEIIEKKQETNEMVVQLEDGTRKTVKQSDTQSMNPPSLNKVEDMARLSHLNEASVLNNLKMRYDEDQIYTYSGLFLVAINPYKKLPIYTTEVIDNMKGKRQEEVSPHIFAIADKAYRQMLVNKVDQSMLITGESGAGKTENTKKVIQYLTTIASKGGVGKLEQQLLQTNPLLEAFGNAKTVRNNNSSRFGKFIEIDFGAAGYIVGTKIQNYLLETTRVVSQNPDERNFHFFYQMCQNPDSRQKYLLGEPQQFKYLNTSGCYHVAGVDDKKEFVETLKSMEIIGLNEDERDEICAISAAILHLGNIEFTKIPGAGKDGAEIKDKTTLNLAAKFLGVEPQALETSIINPTITAGTQVIKTHANPEQAAANRNALVRSIYGRMFDYIVLRINESLSSKEPQKNFIGVLDIAGFEIFEVNSFEQLCINYTNEKLQQFFNHHMFKREQDEYVKEKIDWVVMDFGLDLQPTIDMIEKPNGVMSCVDTQTVLPGTNEKSLTAEILKNCSSTQKGAPQIVQKTRFSDIQFTISHYAGEVTYNTTSWLQKNTDPLSEDLKNCMRQSKKKYLNKFFQPTAEERAAQAQNRGRGTRFITVSNGYRTQLKNLMAVLERTEPHFIRCIVPNGLQKPGIIEPFNVLHQLKCNGVLEGIRIVRKGYPGRLIFKDFEKRYSLLAKKAELQAEPSIKGKCQIILQAAQLQDAKHFKLGLTKVFLKAGVEAMLEDMREQKISQIIVIAQAAMRGWLGRQDYAQLKAKIEYIKVIQRNWKTYYSLRDWSWWQLYQRARPEIERRQEEERRRKEREALEKLKQEVAEEQSQIQKIMAEKGNINNKIAALQVDLAANRNRQDMLQQEMKNLQDRIAELESNLKTTREDRRLLEEDKSKFGQILMQRDQLIKTKEDEATRMDDKVKQTQREAESIKKQIGDRDLRTAQADAKMKHTEEEVKNWKQRFEQEAARAKEIDRQRNQADDKIRELNAYLDILGRQKTELENRNKQLTDDIKGKRTESGELQGRLNQLTEEMNGLKVELARKENDLKIKIKAQEDLGLDKKKSDAEFISANEKFNDEVRKRQKVEVDLRHVVGDNGELDQKIQRLKEENKNLEGTLNKQRDENTQQKEKVTQLVDANAQLDNKRANLERLLRETTIKVNEDRDNDKQQISKLQTKLQELSSDLNEQISQTNQQKNGLDNKVKNIERQQRETQKQYSDLQKTKEDLEAKIKKLEGEVTDLTNQINNEKKRGADIEEIKRQLGNDIRNNQQLLDQMKDEQQKMEAKSRKAQQELVDAHDKASHLESERDDLLRGLENQDKQTRQVKSDLDAAKNQLAQLQAEKDKLLADQKALEAKTAELEAQLQTLSGSQKGKGEEGQALAAELEKAKNDKKAVQRKIQQAEQTQKGLQQRLDELQKKVVETSAAREAAELRLRDADTKLATAKSQSDDLSRKLKTLESSIASGQTELQEATNNLNKLKAERRDVATKVEELESHIQDLQSQLDANNSQVKTLQAKLGDTLSKLESEKQLKANVELETGRLKGEADRQKEAADAESKKHKANLESLTQQLESGQNNFTKQQKSLQEEVADLKKELAKLQTPVQVATIDQEAVEKLRREYEQQIARITTQRDDELRNCNELESKSRQTEVVLHDLRDRLELEEKQRKKAEQQKRALTDELEDIRELADEAEELRSELEKAQQEGKQTIAQMKAELEKSRSQRMAIEESLASLKRENENLRAQFEKERSKEGSSGKIKSQFESEINEMESLINKAKKDKANNQKLLKKLERENRELTNKIAQESQNKMDADNKFSTREREIQKMKADLEFQSKNVTRYESENKNLGQEVGKYKESCTKIEEEIAQLKAQIQRTQKKAREMEKKSRSRVAVDDDEDDE